MPIREMPRGNSQHAVPQNIMDVEFKLIGDLTMRQFTYLGVFVSIAYVFFTMNLPPFFKWPLILITVLIGIAFAFVPFEDRGLDEWIVNFFKAVYEEQQMIWKKNPTPPSAFLYQNISLVKQELITLAPTASRRKLENYLENQYQQNTNLDPYEQQEAVYIQKVKEAFGDYTPMQSTSVAVSLEENLIETEELAVGSEISATAESQISEIQNIVNVQNQDMQELSPTPTLTPVQVQPANNVIKTTQIQQPKPTVKRQKIKSTLKVPGNENEIILRTITPDRHSGRKLNNLIPMQGNIVLPIRGERTIKTIEQTAKEEDLRTKADQLKGYIEQLKQSEKITKPKPRFDQAINLEDIQLSNEATELIIRFEKEKIELNKQIEELKAKIRETDPNVSTENKQQNESQLKALENKEAKVEETVTKLKEQVESIKTRSGQKETNEPEILSTKIGQIPDYLQPQTPNAIAGIVRNIRGKGLPGVLLIIKNSKNDPVRAVKTNSLGEFNISSPLNNDKYRIEVDINNTTGFTFDIMSFEAKGEIIPAMEFVGK